MGDAPATDVKLHVFCASRADWDRESPEVSGGARTDGTATDIALAQRPSCEFEQPLVRPSRPQEGQPDG